MKECTTVVEIFQDSWANNNFSIHVWKNSKTKSGQLENKAVLPVDI